MSESSTRTASISADDTSIIIGSALPANAAEVIQFADSDQLSSLASSHPELFVALIQHNVDLRARHDNDMSNQINQVVNSCSTLDTCELNATELLGWFTRSERYQLALLLAAFWRDRGLELASDCCLEVLAACANPVDQDGIDSVDSLSVVAAAIAMSMDAGVASGASSAIWVRACELTGFSLVDLEAQVSRALDLLASSPDALGYGGLTLARHPAVGEPGVSCNRTLISALCGDGRARAHHNALDTLRNRLASGRLGATEMLEHLLSAMKHCGGIRRVHLLEADMAAGMLRSSRQLHVRGAAPFPSLEIAMDAAPALESMLLSPQTRLISPDAVHPDVAALAESPLLPGKHSIVGSLLAGNCPQGIVVADSEGQPISEVDAVRIQDLVQLGCKFLSLFAGATGIWREVRLHPTDAYSRAV